jgi:hypothetical protein
MYTGFGCCVIICWVPNLAKFILLIVYPRSVVCIIDLRGDLYNSYLLNDLVKVVVGFDLIC